MSTAAQSETITALYREHHGWLQGWLRRKLGCSHQAADLAHDTFVRLIAARGREDFHTPRAYLRTVAHGLMVDHFRRRALEQAWLDALAAMPEALAPSPEERLLIFETLFRIDALLDALPETTRKVFLLSQLEGLTYAAIGERLGLSLRTVKRHMHAGFARCLAALL